MGYPGRNVRARLLIGVAAGAILCASTAARAEDRAPITIAAKPLEAALYEFGGQTGVQVLFEPGLISNKQSASVSGETDAQLAMTRMLEGTGLRYRRNGDMFVIVSASDPQSGSAAGDGADQGTVQALIVTAQKREEDIQDVPIAISAFTQEDLTRSQVAGGPDLMTQVPNFTFTKTNFSGYSIQIRGIGTQAISATVDPAVAVAFNNTPFIRNRFFEQEFYDLQRVEVLRGPQGTLYGRNATAGVVNILSAKPSFRYEAKLAGDVANYSSRRVEGMLNLPLVEDKAALRLAGAWTKREGFVTNEITGNPIDGRDLWSTRLSLRVEPTDSISANLIWEHFQEDDDRLRSGKQLCHTHSPTEIGGVALDLPEQQFGYINQQQIYSQGCSAASLYAPESFETPNGAALPYYLPLAQIGTPLPNGFLPYDRETQSHDLRVIESTVDPKYRAKSDLVELQFTADILDNVSATSETAYSTDFLFSTQDFNRFNTAHGAFFDDPDVQGPRPGVLTDGVFCDPQVGCADRLVGVDLSTAKSRQFSQEFRVSSDFDGAFNFSVGANFLRYDTEDKYYVFFNTLTLYAVSHFFNGNDLTKPYIAGVTDNHECLDGLLPGDWTKFQDVTGCIYIDPNPIGSLNDQGHNYFLSKNPYKLISYAMFGEAYYNLTPALKVTAGLRWTVDKKEAPQIPSWLLGAWTYGYPVAEVVRQEWREPTGRLTVDWKPQLGFTDETLLYGSYAHGYKAGGANPPPTAVIAYGAFFGASNVLVEKSLTHPRTFEPEFVDAFELGTKNTLLDGRLTLNANTFYYDYKGYQISQIVDRAAINYNFDAKVWGLELEADWRPLENLRLGFKGGYENTRVADGEQAIDTMDRTAGDPNWVVAKPFPTIPSNCILPTWWVAYANRINIDYYSGAPHPTVCVQQYLLHVDPVTEAPYVPYPDVTNVFPPGFENYPGLNWEDAPNNGEGIAKDLSGNELPNAPHFTATLTADYTLPLPKAWLMTLHSDFYYQSEAWTRIFNMPGYDKLKAYTNVNLAAIFTNEDAGWKMMAYVKNVMDRDSITGAFLNSDDTGLTTNVFLTEPRLYGLRVTKEWTGSGWWMGANPDHPAGAPYPLTIELGGMVQRHDAPNELVGLQFDAAFPKSVKPMSSQTADLDWGDGRSVKVTYRPNGAWSLSLGARFGKTNGGGNSIQLDHQPGFCLLKGTPFEAQFCDPTSNYYTQWHVAPPRYVRSEIARKEAHTLVDFTVGRDFGLGSLPLSSSFVAAGLGYADLESRSRIHWFGIPDWQFDPDSPGAKYEQHDRYEARASADRSFKGFGPVASWAASARLLGDDTNRLDIDWSLGGGVLFGKQKTTAEGALTAQYYNEKYALRSLVHYPPGPTTETTTPISSRRSSSATVPTASASLGLSWTADRMSLGAGYRWERYFNAIDGGLEEHKSYDRTIDGPYFKVSVGFGG